MLTRSKLDIGLKELYHKEQYRGVKEFALDFSYFASLSYILNRSQKRFNLAYQQQIHLNVYRASLATAIN